MSLRDAFDQSLVRIATTGLVPSRWFLKPPRPEDLTARSGMLDIEIAPPRPDISRSLSLLRSLPASVDGGQ